MFAALSPFRWFYLLVQSSYFLIYWNPTFAGYTPSYLGVPFWPACCKSIHPQFLLQFHCLVYPSCLLAWSHLWCSNPFPLEGRSWQDIQTLKLPFEWFTIHCPYIMVGPIFSIRRVKSWIEPWFFSIRGSCFLTAGALASAVWGWEKQQNCCPGQFWSSRSRRLGFQCHALHWGRLVRDLLDAARPWCLKFWSTPFGWLIEGSLEVKLPTIWTSDNMDRWKAEMGRVREEKKRRKNNQKRSEERRSIDLWLRKVEK